MSRLVLAGLLLSIYPAIAQDIDLGARFGRPTLERYSVAQDVSLIVAYGQDHAVCRLLLEPTAESGLWWERPKPTKEPGSVPSALADQLINELAPPGSRIGPAATMVQQMSCAAHLVINHRNVSINRATNEYLPAEHNVTSVEIVWKRSECPQIQTGVNAGGR